MKNNFLTLGLLIFAANAFGQVGVGTTAPAATLQVTGKPTTASSADGIIPPIISRTNLMAKTGYAASQKGAILYVDDISGTAPTVGTSTEFVTSIGYYYFDGGKWMKFSNPVNIYNTDGSLSANRIVTQGANSLAFTSTATNGFSVDGTTFSVDAANNRVGIGTTTPTASLDVKGDAKIGTMPDQSTGSTAVFWNSTSGALETLTSSKRMFNTYNYKVTLTNSDWISNLNLNIPTSDYTVIITAAYFRLPGGANSTPTIIGGISLNNRSIENINSAFSTVATAKSQLQRLSISDKNVYAFQSGGTWRINADYPDASPINGATQTYEWVFDILVINNSMVKVGSNQTAVIPNGSSIASIPMPADL